MHDELFVTVENAIRSKGSHRIIRAAPRGNAKSTIISMALVIYCAVHEFKRYILLVSDTASQANDFLFAIKVEFEDNILLINDFGDLKGIIWTNSDIILSSGVRIQALGAGKKVRGRRYKQYRPDLIVCDDLENDENVVSPDQRKKTKSWYTRALSKAGDERTDIIFLGTIIHYDSLLANVLKNPIYDSRIYRSIIEWSASPLWDQWEVLISNLMDRDRLKTAREFFEANEEEMTRGTKVLWEQKEDYYELMIQRIADGPAAFSAEKQNEPLSDDDRYFLQEWIQYYEDKDLLGLDLFNIGFVDPSMGKVGGDFSAIISLGADPNGYIYVLDADIKRRHPDLIINDVILKNSIYHYKFFGVETNQFQEFFKDTMQKKIKELRELDKKHMSLKLKEVRQHSDKMLRIQSLQPDIKSGRIKFKRDQLKLIEQIVNFPSAAHDDGPDALELATSLLRAGSGFLEYYRDKADESKKKTAISFLQNPNLQRIG